MGPLASALKILMKLVCSGEHSSPGSSTEGRDVCTGVMSVLTW